MRRFGRKHRSKGDVFHYPSRQRRMIWLDIESWYHCVLFGGASDSTKFHAARIKSWRRLLQKRWNAAFSELDELLAVAKSETHGTPDDTAPPVGHPGVRNRRKAARYALRLSCGVGCGFPSLPPDDCVSASLNLRRSHLRSGRHLHTGCRRCSLQRALHRRMSTCIQNNLTPRHDHQSLP